MKIIKKSKMQDGTTIQIEDWSETYPSLMNPFTIGSYPIAKESIDGSFSPKRGERFRLEMDFSTMEEAKEIFMRLESGMLHLKDLKDKFTNLEFYKII